MNNFFAATAMAILTYASSAKAQCLPNTWSTPNQPTSTTVLSTESAPTPVGRINGGAPSAEYSLKPQARRATPNPENATPNNACYVYVIGEWSGLVTDVDVGELTQRIIITGQRWSDGRSTVCTGHSCSDFIESLYSSQPNWIVESFKYFPIQV